MTCLTCGAFFEPRRKDQRFCSAKCRMTGFQRDREHKQREREAKVRLLLRTARESIDDAEELLAPDDP
jgi:predicted nucleic acid-binding Zn ribbon protein